MESAIVREASSIFCVGKLKRFSHPGGGWDRRFRQVEYGYFDDAAREYVITRPDTPSPWINYLGS